MGSTPSQWWIQGLVFKDRLVCQYQRGIYSGGFWYGNNPLSYPTSLVFAQITIIFFFSRTTYVFLQPLRQSMTVAQIVAGIIISPSVLSRNQILLNNFFPPPGRYILKTIANFGFMLQMFISGVMIDMSAIRKSGPKSILIALSGVFISLAFGAVAFYMVRQMVDLDQELFEGIRILIVFNSLTFFMVTSSYLHDLKITNSEIGRLASSSSLVIDLFGLLTTTFGLIWLSPSTDGPPKWMSSLNIGFYYFVVFCILRPMILLILKRTPDGRNMKQTHLLLILVIVMFAWFWGELMGQRFAAFLFGLSLPHGPPLGSALVQKLHVFTSGMLLPLFCTMAGWRVDLHSWTDHKALFGVEIILVLGQMGKFVGTVISSMIVGVSFQDAIPLGLLMTLKGIMEIAIFGIWQDQKLFDVRLYSLAILNIVLFTGLAFPLSQWLYDPSNIYNTVRKRKIMGLSDQGDLQVLACIYNEESIVPMFNILEVSKFQKTGGAISVFALQLIQLSGSTIPILAPLNEYKKSSHFNIFEHVCKAFGQFERESQGRARVQQFVSVTPYKTMHNDICSLAHDKRTSLIILPFHIKWGIDGKIDYSNQQLRSINRKVLQKSPCSVAILIDRGLTSDQGGGVSLHHLTISATQAYQIVMLFIGGADDHEALALSRRMAEHPSVRLNVIWIRMLSDYEPQLAQDVQDLRVMREFHMKTKGHERIILREKIVENGIGTTKAILYMQESANLFIVGRYHEADCPAIQGLAAWSESPEIGALADTLVSSDSRYSILVVQQQPRVDWISTSSRHSKEDDDVFVSVDGSPKSITSSIKSHMSGSFGK